MAKIALVLAAPALIIALFVIGVQSSIWSEWLFLWLGVQPKTADILSGLCGLYSAIAFGIAAGLLIHSRWSA